MGYGEENRKSIKEIDVLLEYVKNWKEIHVHFGKFMCSSHI